MIRFINTAILLMALVAPLSAQQIPGPLYWELEKRLPGRFQDGSPRWGGTITCLSAGEQKANQEAFMTLLKMLARYYEQVSALAADSAAKTDTIAQLRDSIESRIYLLDSLAAESAAKADTIAQLRDSLKSAIALDSIYRQLTANGELLQQMLQQQELCCAKAQRTIHLGIANMYSFAPGIRRKTTSLLLGGSIISPSKSGVHTQVYANVEGAITFYRVDSAAANLMGANPNGFGPRRRINGEFLSATGGGVLAVPLPTQQDVQVHILLGAAADWLSLSAEGVWQHSYGFSVVGGFAVNNKQLSFRFMTEMIVGGNTVATHQPFSGFNARVQVMHSKHNLGFSLMLSGKTQFSPDSIEFGKRGNAGVTYVGAAVVAKF